MSAGGGFFINWLRLTGPKLDAAEVTFRPGLNVIWGASQTGKSFIFACLNYMTGGQVIPKNIIEVEEYTTAALAITIRPDRRLILERSLKGGDFTVYEADDKWEKSKPVTYGSQHDPARTDTISYLLLSTFDAQDNLIVVSKDKAKTRKISFRDIAHFTFIPEQRIIDEETPVYPTKQHTEASVELSTFNFLVSGTNWSGVVALPDMKEARANWSGKNELYEQLIKELETEVGNNPPSIQTLDHQIAACDRTIAETTPMIEENAEAISRLMATRKGAWEISHQTRSRLVVVEQLRDRFMLLNKHYQSDLDRLKFIEEGDYFLSQLGDPHCPFCGKLVDEHTVEQLMKEEELSSIQESVRAETRKIIVNMIDLKKTLNSLEAEQADLGKEADMRRFEIRDAEKIIRQQLEPLLVTAKTTLNEASERMNSLLEQKFLIERLAAMRARHSVLGKEPKRSRKNEIKVVTAPSAVSIRQFADEVGRILKDWRYTTKGTVDFGTKWEMNTDGQPRANQGKGIRAVLHSAFSVGLMQHSIKQALKHPGVVVLDSPLTAYRPADVYDVGDDIQVGFYVDLKRLTADRQVIVLENKEPPASVVDGLQQEHFTGSPQVGRKGFIPSRKSGLPAPA